MTYFTNIVVIEHKTKMDGSETRSALLLIDVQPEWYSESYISTMFPCLPLNISHVLSACRKSNNVEVIHIRALYSKANNAINGENWGKWLEIFQELNPEKKIEIDGTTGVEPFAKEEEGEKVFLKPTFDGFLGTGLHEYLQERQIQKLLIAGLLTSICVLCTANAAFVRGYRVEVIEDCCGDRAIDRHIYSLKNHGNYIYKTVNTTDVIKRFGNSE